MEPVEAEESVEPVEVRIVDVVVLARVRSRSDRLTRSYRASYEVQCRQCSLSVCSPLSGKAVIASSERSRYKSSIDRDARRCLWLASFSTTREHRAVLGSGFTCLNSRGMVYRGELKPAKRRLSSVRDRVLA